MKRLITTTLLCLLFFSPCFAHNPLPDKLVKIAKSIDCIPLQNTTIFDDPIKFLGRPFIYLSHRNSKAVFWCQDKTKPKTYYLVFTKKNKIIDKFQWTDVIGGLTKDYNYDKVNLKNFHLINSKITKKKGPNVEVTPSIACHLDPDKGSALVFAKYKQNWYAAFYH